MYQVEFPPRAEHQHAYDAAGYYHNNPWPPSPPRAPRPSGGSPGGYGPPPLNHQHPHPYADPYADPYGPPPAAVTYHYPPPPYPDMLAPDYAGRKLVT